MKRSELKNYIRETILSKLDEAEEIPIDTTDKDESDIERDIKAIKSTGDTPVVAESDKKKG